MKIVTAAIIFDHQRVFIARRAPGQANAGCWEFPGGKMHPGETLQLCLEREIQEELGVRIKAGDIFEESVYHYEHGAIRLVALYATVLEGEISLSVHDRFVWATPEALQNYALAPADIPIARKLAQCFNG
jgi:8-oxo-dGTP diphosphatase